MKFCKRVQLVKKPQNNYTKQKHTEKHQKNPKPPKTPKPSSQFLKIF